MQRYGYDSAIIILKIDDFKNTNDTYGHLAGDRLLKQLARLISSNVRKTDTVARFGGEEFVIRAPGTFNTKGADYLETLVLVYRKRPLKYRKFFGFSMLAGALETIPG